MGEMTVTCFSVFFLSPGREDSQDSQRRQVPPSLPAAAV